MMNRIDAFLCAAGLGLAGLVLPWSAAHADKPEWTGAKALRETQAVAPAAPTVKVRIGAYFGEQQRLVVHQDHVRMVRAGHCPPGLAKKGNGCHPPGQAKKAYVVGQPLPPGVVYHELSPVLAVQLGPPPAGHRFVRVAADILLIAVGTSMVIDAIEDLGR